MSNGILRIIALLEEEIDQSPKPRIGAGNKRIVDCDRLLDILGDLKVSIPEEVRQAQTIIAEKDNLLKNARIQSSSLLSDARVQMEKMVSREGVLAEAEFRAKRITDQAYEKANLVMSGARSYTNDILEDTQRYLHEYIEIIEKNRLELEVKHNSDTQEEAIEEEIIPVRKKRKLDAETFDDAKEDIGEDDYDDPYDDIPETPVRSKKKKRRVETQTEERREEEYQKVTEIEIDGSLFGFQMKEKEERYEDAQENDDMEAEEITIKSKYDIEDDDDNNEDNSPELVDYDDFFNDIDFESSSTSDDDDDSPKFRW